MPFRAAKGYGFGVSHSGPVSQGRFVTVTAPRLGPPGMTPRASRRRSRPHEPPSASSHRARRGHATPLAGTPVSEASGEAAALHAVWEVGLQTVRERVEDAGYGELAAERTAPTAALKAVARRRRPPWADEP